MDEATNYALSPEGLAIAPRLNEPDSRYSKPGTYWTKLRVSADKAAALVAEIDARMKENLETTQSRALAVAQRCAPATVRMAPAPYQVDTDGSVIFTFKRRALQRGYKRI